MLGQLLFPLERPLAAPKGLTLKCHKPNTFHLKSKASPWNLAFPCPDTVWFVLLVFYGCWFSLFQSLEGPQWVRLSWSRLDWTRCAFLSVFGFRLWQPLADLDCLLLLGWIKCATDRRRGSAVTQWVDLSATCCLHLVKTGEDLISPGSHKLHRPTCCPCPLADISTHF